MSYLHPAYYRLLPPTARPQLIAYLQLVERNAHASPDGWADIRQAVIAAELGRQVWSVKRYERICRDVGILEVEEHGRHNRRRLRLRSAKEALAANQKPSACNLREWCDGSHHRGVTHHTSVDNSHLYPRARSDRGDLLRYQTPKPAAPAERAPHSPARPGRAPGRNGAAPWAQTNKAWAHMLAELDLGARWVRPIAELAHRLVERSSDREAAGYLEKIVLERARRQVHPYARAKAVIALLNARLRTIDEKRR